MLPYTCSASSCIVMWLLVTCSVTSCELLQNRGFEDGLDHWQCNRPLHCEVLDSQDSHDGSHAVRTHNRTQKFHGPQQTVQTSPGKDYHIQSWIKILNDLPDTLGQPMKLEITYHFPDNSNKYSAVAMRPFVSAADGWFLLQGQFQVPPQEVEYTTFIYQGPAPGVDFAVDQASLTEVVQNDNWRNESDDVINRLRKSDINVQVTTARNIDRSDIRIQVLQTKKAFPFGIWVDSWAYQDPSRQQYRDFIQRHFEWTVPGNCLKWRQIDTFQGSNETLYPRALDTLTGLRNAGHKIRGHNMVWSVERFVPESVRAQSGTQLRSTVRQHINWLMNQTRGLLEHWDVNNENLHGQWFQERLHDRDYDLELFRMMYQADHYPKLFLNEYQVVSSGSVTSAYVEQAQRFKDANVHLYGIGVQSHFHDEQRPNPTLMKRRLDMLATVGVPIWATELDVSAQDENDRADYIELAVRALYGHPAVEGILFWGIYADTRSDHKALFYGDDIQPTAGGRRLLDLLENEWMTDHTQQLDQSSDRFSLRGFHGEYEVHVYYRGQELSDLRQTFTLEKETKSVNINVHAETS